MIRNILILLFMFFTTCNYIFSWESRFFKSSFINIPEGWYVLENKENKVTFADSTDSAYLQIKRYPGNTFDTAIDIYNSILVELDALGEGELFSFDTRESYFSSIKFSSSGSNYQGYLVCIEGEIEDIVLLGFSHDNTYDIEHDFILSAIDSFSLNESGLKNSGPVSQFYYPNPGMNKTISYLPMNSKIIPLSFDLREIDATYLLVEREARILIQYTNSELSNLAWLRYYKLIYRDNYTRLGRIARILSREIIDNFESLNDFEKSSVVLDWIQNFEYIRLNTLSDFMTPIDTVITAKGDCDSRGLLYVILLEYYGIDAILMVSSEYSHSIVGVAVEGKGAHYNHDGLKYLTAETTDNVPIGLIDQTMADPSKWMGITF